MRSIWKGAITFGLVTIPIKIYSSAKSKRINFSYLHKKCSTPLEYRRFCPVCGEKVEWGEIAKGYEISPGRFVVITDEELSSLPRAAGKAIEIVDFIGSDEIDLVLYQKSYYLGPGDGGQRPYALLREALKETGKIALARFVLRSRETLAAVRASGNILSLSSMYYPEEVRSAAEVPGLDDIPKSLPDRELKLAVDLVDNLTAAFEPTAYKDRYREEIMQLIEAKAQGETVSVPQEAPQAEVVDLMDALQASLDKARENKQGKKAKKSSRKRRQPAAAG